MLVDPKRLQEEIGTASLANAACMVGMDIVSHFQSLFLSGMAKLVCAELFSAIPSPVNIKMVGWYCIGCVGSQESWLPVL
jgi:hypothetical protein